MLACYFNTMFTGVQHVSALIEIDALISPIIIHQTHYEKSDWSRAFNQFRIACELDMINAISAEDIAWLLSSLECSP